MDASGDAAAAFPLTVDDVGHAMIVTDLDGTVTVWNRAAEELYGWRAAEAMGRPVDGLTSPILAADEASAIIDKVIGGGIWSGELFVRDRDGVTFLATVTAGPLRDGRGETIGIVGTSRRARGPDHRRWRPRAAGGGVADAFLVLEADGTIIHASDDLEALVPAASAATSPVPYWDFVHPEDHETLAAAFATVRSTGHASTRGRVLGMDGAWKWVEATGALLPGDPSGQRIVLSARDVDELVRTERSLEVSDARFEAIVRHGSDAAVIATPDPDATIVYASPAVTGIFGYTPDEVVGHSGFTFVHPDDQVRVRDVYRRTVAGEQTEAVEMRVRHRDGTWRWVEERITNLIGEPAIGGIVGNLRDIDQRRRLQDSLVASEQRYRTIIERAGEGICWYDTRGRVEYANPRLGEIVGVEPEDIVGTPVLDYVQRDDLERLRDALMERLTGRGGRYDTRLVRPGGEVVHVRVASEPLFDRAGAVTGGVAMVTDLTDRHAAERELRRRATTDPLTSLPNRTLLVDRTDQALLRAQRHDLLVAVLFIDIDQFKFVNDSLGHSYGDALLCELAGRLDRNLRSGDTTVARFGGDEFVVVCEALTDVTEADAVAERVRVLIAEPTFLHGRELHTTASVGIAVGPPGSAESLISDADAAMYRAKDAGRNRYAQFDSTMRTRADRRVTLGADLSRAIAGGELDVHFQPVLPLGSSGLDGFEALVRWNHPEHGWVPPTEFVELSEQNGLVGALSAVVLDKAIACAADWNRTSAEPVQLSVNLSALQLSDPALPDSISALLERHGLHPSRLVLEITESTLMASGTISDALAPLTALGATFALDDFGTGYSSLLYLRDLPFDIIKLDRLFVAGVVDDPTDRSIVRAVIDLAHTLGLRTVAEGIETTPQLDVLTELGCDSGQGWLWSKAIDERSAARIVTDGLPHLRQPPT